MPRITTDMFVARFIAMHGEKYNYSLVDYKDSRVKVKIVCGIHGLFEQLPHAHSNGRGCPKCGTERTTKHNSLTAEDILKRFRRVHGDTYIYPAFKANGNRDKINIICKTHGEFSQNVGNHINGNGCYDCHCESRRASRISVVSKFEDVHGHGKYDYTLVDYVNDRTKVKILCQEHGIFMQKPNDHKYGKGCPDCASSYMERIFIELLDRKAIKYKKEKTFKDLKNPITSRSLRYDFYLKDSQTLVELHGRQHYEPHDFTGSLCEQQKVRNLENLQYRDELKKEYAIKNNIKLIVISHKDFSQLLCEELIASLDTTETNNN